jgi:hypothetical protein
MGPNAAAAGPGRALLRLIFALLRLILLLAALDSLAGGVWALARPGDLFRFLGTEPRDDRWMVQLLRPTEELLPPSLPPEERTRHLERPRRDAGLWNLLGLFGVVNAGLLVLAAGKPLERVGLVFVPFLGYALRVGVWLWALEAVATFPLNRLPFRHPERLLVLAFHDALWTIWLAPFAVAAMIGRRAGLAQNPPSR